MSKVVSKERCPECARNGGDSSGDNLAVYEDGSQFCFSCQYTVSSKGKTKMSYQLPPSMPMPEAGIKSKKLTFATCQRFNVVHLVELDKDYQPITEPNETGEGHKFVGSGIIGFPYYDIDTGVPVAMKVRDFSVPKKEGMKWRGQGDKATWFGINAIPANATKVILVEGETDTLTVAQLFPECAVLGASGWGSVEKNIKQSLHVLRKFKQIVLAFDNDTDGAKATESALQLLPAGKPHIVTWPSDIKDPNELLCAAREAELKRCIKDAKQVTPKGVVDKQDFKQRLMDVIFNKELRKGHTTGFASLDRAIGGLRPGKMLTVAAGTGAGKSTFIENIALNAALECGVKSFFIPLEMADTEVGERMVQRMMKAPICNDPDFDVSTLDFDQFERVNEFIAEHIRFYDHYGSLSVKEIVEIAEFAIESYGVELLILDHMTAAASGSEGLDWKQLDACASELKGLALRKGVALIVVSHISRDGDNEDEVPKIKHLRGGNGLAQYSDCVLGLGRKRDSDKMMVRTIKVDRRVGKFTEFELLLRDYSLQENGVVRDFVEYTEEEDEYDGSAEGYQDGKVSEQMGGTGSKSKQTSSVRTNEDKLHNTAFLQTRLSTSEPGDSGVQRHNEQRGEDEVYNFEEAVSRLASTSSLPKWDSTTDFLQKEWDDLPAVGD